MHPFFDGGRFLAFAHRGGAVDVPENTMAAFEYAVDLGYRYLETDAHLTKDGVLLAFHDDVLDRVTDKTGVIAEMDWAEIKQARVEGTEPIVELEPLLRRWPHVRFNIDTKHDPVVRPVVELIRRLNMTDRICIGSFSQDRLTVVRRELGPQSCTSMGPREVMRFAAQSMLRLPRLGSNYGARCIQVPSHHRGLRLVTRRFVDRAHALGLFVHVWTIDDPDEMHQLIDLGVDGLMTDRPRVLKDVLCQRNRWYPN